MSPIVRKHGIGFCAFLGLSCVLHAWTSSGLREWISFPSFLLIFICSYYVYAFIFGLKMPIVVGDLESKKHGLLRSLLVIIFFIFWLKLIGVW